MALLINPLISFQYLYVGNFYILQQEGHLVGLQCLFHRLILLICLLVVENYNNEKQK